MKIANSRWAAITVFLPMLVWSMLANSQGNAVPVDSDDVGGVVTSADGPEAGVWVIAETGDFDTFFAKIVVTDDEGRYLVPDLPEADYELWVRGYGLADSEKVAGERGSVVDLTAVIAPNEAVAAEVYPAAAWYAMMHLPNESDLGHVPGGLNEYLGIMKNQTCVGCHQLGNLATRTIPEVLGEFENSQDAWVRRVQSGQAASQMINPLAGRLGGVPFQHLADWTDRIAAGETPSWIPERPQGIERNVVATVRDWADPKSYLHDLSSTDRRNPTLNPYGKIYGAPELSTDNFPILDPVANTAVTFRAPVRDADTPTTNTAPIVRASPYWGEERIWDSQANAHNPMFDHKGRVWYTARVRGPSNPDYCREGSDHPSAQLFPTERTNRNLAVYEPETEEYTFIDTCYSTHHLQFAEDEDNTLWTSGGGQVIGWLNTRMYLETGDEAASQGWAPLILDTNGNGRQDEYVEPNEPVDPTKDKRVTSGYYGVAANPVDGTIWGSSLGFPGAILRLDPGPNPPQTALTEVYELPLDNPAAPVQGYSPRGMDIDRNGVVWAPLASGHLASFDRRKCTGPLNGPTATGQHCPEGWTLYQDPGPQIQNLTEPGSVEASYYTWVDQFNTLGLGENVPISTGNANEGLLALVDGEWVVMRVPYPLGFYTKWMDGRIDDPDAGWKGRGIWATYSTRAPFHLETGAGTPSKVVHFQMRPDPLAR